MTYAWWASLMLHAPTRVHAGSHDLAKSTKWVEILSCVSMRPIDSKPAGKRPPSVFQCGGGLSIWAKHQDDLSDGYGTNWVNQCQAIPGNNVWVDAHCNNRFSVLSMSEVTHIGKKMWKTGALDQSFSIRGKIRTPRSQRQGSCGASR